VRWNSRSRLSAVGGRGTGRGFIGKKSWGNPWENPWNKYGLIDVCGDFWMGKKSMGKEGKEMEV
jgi:hypothetical protein